MKKETKKLISLLIALSMVVAILPSGLTALATSGTPGNVTNLMTKFDSSTPTAALTTSVASGSLTPVLSSTAAAIAKYDSTTGYATTQDRVAAAVSENNPYWTKDTSRWAFGDRNPRPTTENDGSTSSKAIRSYTEFVITNTTSSILLGSKVTKILALNSEKNFTPTIPDVYSFTIDQPATVYVASGGTAYDTNFVTTNGWTKEAALTVNRAATTVVQNTTGDNLYYAIPNGTTSMGTVYSMHFAQGTVNIPSRGAANSTQGMAIFIIWDSCSTNTKLSSLNYSYTGAVNTFGSVGPWTLGDSSGTYNVAVGPTVTSVTLSATSADANATVAYEGGNTTVPVPGSKVVTVTAADGTTIGTYTVNFTNTTAVSNTIKNYAKRSALALGTLNDISGNSGAVGINLQLNGTEPVYNDRLTSMFLASTTSSIFKGGTVVRTAKDDTKVPAYYGTSNLDWSSFQVLNDATVYYALPVSNTWQNGLDRGWVKDTSSPTLSVVDNMTRTNIYKKLFLAGESVIIPSLGCNISSTPGNSSAVLIVWAKDKITNIALNTPNNLYQLSTNRTAVNFVATSTPVDTVDVSTIQWYVNDVLQQGATGLTFSYTPPTYGNFIVTAKVSNNQNAVVESRTITVNHVLDADSSIQALSYTHPELGKQAIAVVTGKKDYDVVLPYGISSTVPQVSATPTSSFATQSIISPSQIPGAASVNVIAEDGSFTTYTINFTVSTTPSAAGIGEVSVLTYRGTLSSLVAGTSPVAVNGLQAVNPVNILTDDVSYSTMADKILASQNPAVNLYKNDTFRVYTDRTPSTGGGDGSSANALIGGYSEFSYVVSDNAATSPEFVSPNITRILTMNSEKSKTDSIPDAYTFTINKPAMVYVVCNTDSANIVNNGWIQDTTGLKISRGANSALQYSTGTGADGKYYAVPNGSLVSYNNIYLKHYTAGANVSIPSVGAASSSGLIVLIAWDTVQQQPISSLVLNTPTNLNQTYGATTEVKFDATVMPATDVDRSKVDWYVNGVKQTTGIRSSFSFTPNAAGTYVVTAKVSDNPNAVTDSKTIMVEKADPIVTWPVPEAVSYVQGLTLANIQLEDGFTWADPTTPINVPGGSYEAIYTPTDTTNYNIMTQNILVTVTMTYGDINSNGVIDISDVIMAAEIAVGTSGYTDVQKQAANVSSKTEEEVDISDVVLIAERAVGGTIPFPVEQSN